MLIYSPQAIGDLTQILAGLISFRIGNATSPALTQEHAEEIYDDILTHIESIPDQLLHRANTFEGIERYGKYVYSYRRNRTNWYAFYDKVNDDFIVRRISNNWNILLPRL